LETLLRDNQIVAWRIQFHKDFLRIDWDEEIYSTNSFLIISLWYVRFIA